MTLLLIFACASVDSDSAADPVAYTDHATATLAACEGLSTDEPGPAAWADPAHLSLPSRACLDHIVADFGLDEDSFRITDDLPDLYGVVDGADLTGTRLASFLAMPRALLVLPYGDVADLDSSTFVSQPFVETMTQVAAETGQTQLGPTLYNFSASIIAHTVASGDDTWRASFEGAERRLIVRLGAEPEWVSGQILVHEPRHLWGGHVQCPYEDSVPHCDADTTGTLGFELATAVLLYRNLAALEAMDAEHQEDMESSIYRLMSHILAYMNDTELRDDISSISPADW